MDCEYWQDIVKQLSDTSRCNWAAHVLATDINFKETLSGSKLEKQELAELNLGIALACISEEEVIRGAIYAYRDPNSQPDCDLILAQFSINQIVSVYSSMEIEDSSERMGVERFLEIISEELSGNV